MASSVPPTEDLTLSIGSSIQTLPPELLLHILKTLPLQDLRSMGLVNKQFLLLIKQIFKKFKLTPYDADYLNAISSLRPPFVLHIGPQCTGLNPVYLTNFLNKVIINSIKYNDVDIFARIMRMITHQLQPPTLQLEYNQWYLDYFLLNKTPDWHLQSIVKQIINLLKDTVKHHDSVKIVKYILELLNFNSTTETLLKGELLGLLLQLSVSNNSYNIFRYLLTISTPTEELLNYLLCESFNKKVADAIIKQKNNIYIILLEYFNKYNVFIRPTVFPTILNLCEGPTNTYSILVAILLKLIIKKETLQVPQVVPPEILVRLLMCLDIHYHLSIIINLYLTNTQHPFDSKKLPVGNLTNEQIEASVIYLCLEAFIDKLVNNVEIGFSHIENEKNLLGLTMFCKLLHDQLNLHRITSQKRYLLVIKIFKNVIAQIHYNINTYNIISIVDLLLLDKTQLPITTIEELLICIINKDVLCSNIEFYKYLLDKYKTKQTFILPQEQFNTLLETHLFKILENQQYNSHIIITIIEYIINLLNNDIFNNIKWIDIFTNAIKNKNVNIVKIMLTNGFKDILHEITNEVLLSLINLKKNTNTLLLLKELMEHNSINLDLTTSPDLVNNITAFVRKSKKGKTLYKTIIKYFVAHNTKATYINILVTEEEKQDVERICTEIQVQQEQQDMEIAQALEGEQAQAAEHA